MFTNNKIPFVMDCYCLLHVLKTYFFYRVVLKANVFSIFEEGIEFESLTFIKRSKVRYNVTEINLIHFSFCAMGCQPFFAIFFYMNRT